MYNEKKPKAVGSLWSFYRSEKKDWEDVKAKTTIDL